MDKSLPSFVAKIGGSLLFSPNGLTKFTRWLQQQVEGRWFVIVGGGELVEAMRVLDRIYEIAETEMHWRCIDLLNQTFFVARSQMPHCRALETALEFDAFQREPVCHEVVLVRVGAYYSPTQTIAGFPEPATNWNTTSDSLAGLLGCLIGARKVYLLKTCPIDASRSLQQLSHDGIVDSEVIQYLEWVDIQCVTISD